MKTVFTRLLIAAILLVLSGATTFADGPRVALIIGNSAYQHTSRLTNPVNDANDVGRALRNLGFEATVVLNADVFELEQAVSAFADQLRRSPDSAGIFYYAGHAVQSGGVNYLLPVDADIRNEAELRRKAIAAQEVMDLISQAQNRFNMVVLDACRDNPFAGSFRSASRGLAAATSAPPETLVVYATDAGDVAADGTGRNSPFTAAFLANVATPGIDVEAMMRNVSADVNRMTNRQQRPWRYSSVTTGFVLVPGEVPAVRNAPVQPGFQVERTTGSIRVTVATAGTVYLDGDRIGDLRAGQSATLSDVETGSRRLEIRYENGERENSTVTVRDGATATARFSFVVRAEPEAFRVGDRGPAGGVVVYDKGRVSDGWRYLEAWTTDESGTYQWKTSRTSTPGTSTAIGSGYANTYTAMSGTQHPAAQVARNASHGGFNDWFLPSKDELNLMYQQRGVIGGFGSVIVWSSSEFDSNFAWYQTFGNGGQYSSSKASYYRVRVVRAFNP